MISTADFLRASQAYQTYAGKKASSGSGPETAAFLPASENPLFSSNSESVLANSLLSASSYAKIDLASLAALDAMSAAGSSTASLYDTVRATSAYSGNSSLLAFAKALDGGVDIVL